MSATTILELVSEELTAELGLLRSEMMSTRTAEEAPAVALRHLDRVEALLTEPHAEYLVAALKEMRLVDIAVGIARHRAGGRTVGSLQRARLDRQPHLDKLAPERADK